MINTMGISNENRTPVLILGVLTCFILILNATNLFSQAPPKQAVYPNMDNSLEKIVGRGDVGSIRVILEILHGRTDEVVSELSVFQSIEIEAVNGNLIQVTCPVSLLATLSSLNSIKFIRPPLSPIELSPN